MSKASTKIIFLKKTSIIKKISWRGREEKVFFGVELMQLVVEGQRVSTFFRQVVITRLVGSRKRSFYHCRSGSRP